MRRPKGATALERALREDLAPMFGAVPFTVALQPAPFEVRPDIWAVCVNWAAWGRAGAPCYHPAWGFWLPVYQGMFAERAGRHGLVDYISRQVWRREWPRSRRARRRWASTEAS